MPPITVVSITVLGWRWVLYIFGAVGIIWSLFWHLTYRNMPEEHKWVSQAEPAHVRGVDEKGRIKQVGIENKPDVPWRALLKHSNMWAIMCAYFTYGYCLWIFLSWLPSYLTDYRGFTLLKMGWFASLPLFAGVIGDTAGGCLTDALLAKTGSSKFARRSVATTGMLGCMAFIMPVALTANLYAAVYCLTGAMFFLECMIGPPSGGVDGCRRTLLRKRLRDDEHDGEHRRRALPHCLWSPSRPWLLGGAFHPCRVSTPHRRGHLGILA